MIRPQEPLFDKENQTWFYIDGDNNIHKSEEYMHLLSQYAVDMKKYCDYLENMIYRQDDDDEYEPWKFK